MLYLSQTSELGYVYGRAEFDALCDWAETRDLAVYVDGARMASGCMAQGGDLTIQRIASRATAFTLGGLYVGTDKGVFTDGPNVVTLLVGACSKPTWGTVTRNVPPKTSQK